MELNLQAAQRYARHGLWPFPVRPDDSKSPMPFMTGWETRIDTDIEQWFGGHPERNLALRMGPQPGGFNLYAIDIDPKNGGDAAWAALLDEHGPPPPTAHHLTPSGGEHLFFVAPDDLLVVNKKLAVGVDTRGPKGYVVAPPSALSYGRYEADRSSLVTYVPFAELMPWAVEILRPKPPSTNGDRPHRVLPPGRWSPFDFVREHLDWHTYLVKHGWVWVRGEFWRHPTASNEHSAALKNNGTGPLNVWSTSMPNELVALDRSRTEGTLVFTLFDFIAAYEFGGDVGACERWVTERYGPAVRPATGVSEPHLAVAPAGRGEPPPEPTVPLHPPPEWYLQRPWLAMCQQMAQAVGGSPAAHVLAYLTRWATLVPPGFSIPPINGAPSSFDLLGVVAGTSGSGKTSALRNAATLLPVLRDDMRMGLGLGSGEGIIEAFYGVDEVEGDDGKTRRVRRKTITGVNFAISEGLIFADLAQRGGTTHVTRLCDAWSGAALSTANASSETFRHIDVNQYRLTLMMGIQVDRAHELMTESAASQGFVGRLLFVWAEEPRIQPRPSLPEPVTLVVPNPISTPATRQRPRLFEPQYLTYPAAVITECQTAADARVGQPIPVEEHHHDLLRLKVAGLFALMDDRTAVSEADWDLSTTLCMHSQAVREFLHAHKRRADRDREHNRATARADTEITIEDVKERQHVARIAAAIIRQVSTGAKGRNALRKACCSASTKHLLDRAIDHAIAAGAAVLDGDQIREP
jgi:hypothetical protein